MSGCTSIYKFLEVELDTASASKNKIEQNYLDGSAFAIVFLRAEHVCATVFICNFEHSISRFILTYHLCAM